VSFYPDRGEDGTDEALCDAGGIAMSKDTVPIEGYGWVKGRLWFLKMTISQDHGISAQTAEGGRTPA
jgi:D-serine deaminase-like pyridoxal phosphate-dependent protein